MMPWLGWLFFGFRGRISRKSWWLAQASFLATGIGVYVAMHGLKLPESGTRTTMPELLLSLLLFVPDLAVAHKRLNDRGHKLWLTFLWLGMSILSLIGDDLDLFNSEQMTIGQQVLLAVLFILILWFFIDLGLLRGDTGPNSHGPDPLGSKSPAPATHRRTIGENIRDAITGLAVVIAIGIVLVPHSVERLFAFAIDPMLVPSQLREENRIWQERMNNKPASKEQNDGLAAYQANDYDGALTHFTRAIELFGPDKVAAEWSYKWRGITLERLGRLQDARADYEKAATLDEPDDWLKRALERVK